jgi:protein-S-isoprenylcysteine O-methyltransferase Ste14
LLFQIVHLLEEYSTGFHRLYPPVLGLMPWSSNFFLSINLFCIAIWVWALFSLKEGSRLALAPTWFFALAGLANGIGHPLLAVYVGGYFPGLLTAPLVGFTGGWLFVRLLKTTAPRRDNTVWRQAGLFFETILFSVMVPGAVAFWIPRDTLHLWKRMLLEHWMSWHSIAMVPLTIGSLVYLRCLWEFAVQGNGIPAPVDHPKQLVITGLYRYVRNPMYVGVLLFLLGEATFFTSWRVLAYAIAWLAFVHVNVILYEEPNLRRKFNGPYEHYRSVVHRWIPGRPYGGKPDRDPGELHP